MNPNPPLDARREQLSAEKMFLEKEIAEIKEQLSYVFQGEKFGISSDGQVEHELGQLEMDAADREAIADAEKRLKQIYERLKKISN